MFHLAFLLTDQGSFGKAESIYREIIAIKDDRILDEERRNFCRNGLGAVLSQQERTRETAELLEIALAKQKAKWGSTGSL